jgi:hypothetical protein
MAPPNTRADAIWAVDRATGLPEVWALVASHLELVGAWRVMRVCKASRRLGAKEILRTRSTMGLSARCRGSWCAAGLLMGRK